MTEIQETERIDHIMPYLQDLVQHETKREVEWVESPLHIRFGREEKSCRVLCDNLPIYDMTINTPFIGIQTRSY